MKKNLLLFISFLLILPLIGGSCLEIKIRTGKADGGVFKSVDKGETWEQKVFVRQIKKKKVETIGYVNVYKLRFDPQNSQTVYLASREDGLYVTYNGGDKWYYLSPFKGRIDDVVVHPKSRNIIYLARGNKIYKTTNGGESWGNVYLESLPNRRINCLAIDSYDPKKVYAGISDGRLIRSVDAGESWEAIANFKDNIAQILINKNDTRIIYVATSSTGIYRTADRGNTWQNITVNDKREDLREFHGIREFRAAVFDQTKFDSLVIATRYGLLRTDNGGKSWQAYKLLTLPGTILINSLAVNPKNNQEIYYITNHTLFKTDDGGENWVTRALPTSRIGCALLVNPEHPQILFLGVYKPKKK